MKTTQIILNAILSKRIFEYVLVNRDFQVIQASDGIVRYLNAMPQKGEDVLEYFPEFIGNEEEIRQIFVKRHCLYTLESIYKNEYYVNISIEYCDQETAIILLHNITSIAVTNQRLLQYSNESTLLYHTLQKVVDNQNALVFVANDERIEFANQKFLNYIGVESLEQLRENSFNFYTKIEKTLESYDALFERIQSGKEQVKIGKDTFLIQATLVESTYKLFTLTKITHLSDGMQIDPLTGIYRRGYFDEVLAEFLHKKDTFALAMIDLDNFKKVNDTYGHLAGDKVLKSFVSVIKKHIRKDDFFARWGGEEFMLLLANTPLESAQMKLDRLCEMVAQHPIEEVGRVTASFGFTYSTPEDELDTIIQRADEALYEAKRAGKNCVIFKK